MTSTPRPSDSLDVWLDWLENLHPVAIDMELGRVADVADRMGLIPAKKPFILVGGTNGKGSTVAMLSAIYRSAGYKVGAYTSPHIEHFCERIKVDGAFADEAWIVDALQHIDNNRAPESLTYFEFTTLAAMHVFNEQQCDVLLFEVGLGGRLDATNIWDADCSIITSIGLDHEEYLGSDTALIAVEKAAIGRPGKPFVVGEHNPPDSLSDYATQHAFELVDVGSTPQAELPETSLAGAHQKRNAGCAVAAVTALGDILPVSDQTVRHALMNTFIDGRFERRVIGGVQVIFDAAHNPAGALELARTWAFEFPEQRCEIIFATLADKDIAGVVDALKSIVHTWHCVSLDTPRALGADQLVEVVSDCLPELTLQDRIRSHGSVADGMSQALQSASEQNRLVLVAGSFYTIAGVKAMSARQLTADGADVVFCE